MKWDWIDFAAINKRIKGPDYTGRTIDAAAALFPEGTNPHLVMITVDPEIFTEDHCWEAARDAQDHYGADNMPPWWESAAKTGVRFVGGIDPTTGGPFMVIPNPSDMGIRFVEPALRELGAQMDDVAFDMLLGFFINMNDENLIEWVQQIASGSGGQVGQTFVLTPEDIAAHGFMTSDPDLVPGCLMIGPYGTCDIDLETVFDGFEILIGCYADKALIDMDAAEAALQRLSNYIDDRKQRFDQAAFDALPSTDTWKDRLFPNRQHRGAIAIARKLCP